MICNKTMSVRIAALVIGNEILSGKVRESNVELLAQELFAIGAELCRVVVCQDDIETIAADLRELSRRYDYVITSGGVGPTHDDVTIKAVARTFDRPVVRSPELERQIRGFVGTRIKETHLRMADVPEGAILLSTPEVPWPTILMSNVFVLPGLPNIFQLKMPLLREHIKSDGPFRSRAVYTTCRETDLAEQLDEVDAAHPEVRIGSYPVVGATYRVRLTFDGKDLAAIDRAVEDLLARLPCESIVTDPESLAPSGSNYS
jgi:molybdenum cofactor synthesis domain-containing protein